MSDGSIQRSERRILLIVQLLLATICFFAVDIAAKETNAIFVEYFAERTPFWVPSGLQWLLYSMPLGTFALVTLGAGLMATRMISRSRASIASFCLLESLVVLALISWIAAEVIGPMNQLQSMRMIQEAQAQQSPATVPIPD